VYVLDVGFERGRNQLLVQFNPVDRGKPRVIPHVLTTVGARSKALFRFLSGEPTSTPSTNQLPTREPAPTEKEPSSVWSFAGLFSGIKGKRRGGGLDGADGRVFLDGEVHAELVRNDKGYFDFKDLVVEIPNSHTPSRIQVAVVLSGQGD